MSYTNEIETLYKIGQDDKGDLLYLREVEDGFHYETYNMETKKREYDGLLTWGDMEDCPIRNPLAAARTLAIEEVGLDYGPIAKVSLRMLEDYRESPIRSRALWEPDSLPLNDIRFIDSQYHELFRIPNNGTIMIDYPDRHFAAKCQYLDEYHTSINGEVFHICQFAEMLERNRGTCRPEPEIYLEAAAWRIGESNYLTVETHVDSWRYSLYDRKFNKVAHDQYNDPNLSAREVREKALADLKMPYRSRTRLSYSYIKEKAQERAKEEKAESRPSILDQLKEKRPEQSEGKEVPRKAVQVER